MKASERSAVLGESELDTLFALGMGLHGISLHLMTMS